MDLPKYDPQQSYQWNYDNAPSPDSAAELQCEDSVLDEFFARGTWTYCGLPSLSPIGMPAGPLLNGKWLLYYANLGFDVLTYKTVRSRKRACYPLPNLQPIQEQVVHPNQRVHASHKSDSWAISFGMPSMAPEVWRNDLEWTREQLPEGKILSVSVVATAEPDWTLEQVADDYAQCARWAAESGAECVELNFSCPNVASVDGQLDRDPASARQILEHVRSLIPETKLLIKVGFIDEPQQALELLSATTGLLDGIATTNCLACSVQANPGELSEISGLLFGGEKRGIGGAAIRYAAVDQVALLRSCIDELQLPISVIGVGGVSTREHVKASLEAGAESVQLATAAMLDPLVGLRLKNLLPAQ
ncbi:MAG: hypothetical protein VXZ82_02300 [Planctomycetota bacterium]|nr:hypothetical protein [Planctomycetota bacterium]